MSLLDSIDSLKIAIQDYNTKIKNFIDKSVKRSIVVVSEDYVLAGNEIKQYDLNTLVPEGLEFYDTENPDIKIFIQDTTADPDIVYTTNFISDINIINDITNSIIKVKNLSGSSINTKIKITLDLKD